jgi:hypothetical protein
MMMMKYKGKTPVKRGDKVELLDNEGTPYLKARVLDALATQFTITTKGQVRFFFYEDKGLTWRVRTSD